MSVTDDRLYHQDRARAELDLAYRADGHAAAAAHLLLSSLHMRRLEDLRKPESSPDALHAAAAADSPAGARA